MSGKNDALQTEISSEDYHGLRKHPLSQGEAKGENFELVVIGTHCEPQELRVLLPDAQMKIYILKVQCHHPHVGSRSGRKD